MKKAILGGTFDPVHIGHLNIAYEALYQLKLDKVIFMPSGNPPHKVDKKITDGKIRYEMIKKAIEGEKSFEVSDYEINKKKLSFTYETLELFNNLERSTNWFFITGVDCLMEIDTWKNVDRILNNCNFVVFNRPGYTLKQIMEQKKRVEEKYKKDIIFLDIPLLDISATKIRNKVLNGEKVDYLVSKPVFEIIKRFKIYT